MNTLRKEDIFELSVPERIQLVKNIWDSLPEKPESILLSKEQEKELDKRLDSYHAHPDQGSPWDVVREKIKRL